MKKQVFSLMMVLALVVLAGTNGFAQNSAADNDSGTTYLMVTGSTHTFSTTLSGNNTAAWGVYNGGGLVDDSGGTSTDITTANTSTGASIQVTWAESAGGSYYVQVTETRPADGDLGGGDVGAGCAETVRRFYIIVTDFDVRVYASTSAGVEISAEDDLANCGEGTVAQYGDEGGVAFSNAFNSGDLANYIGTDIRTTRWVTVEMNWNAALDVADVPAIGSIVFNYDIDATRGVLADDLYQVNNEDPTSLADGTGTLTLDGPGSAGSGSATHQKIFIVPVTWNDRWGHDITSTFDVKNTTVYSAAAAGGSVIGIEPVGRETAGGTGGRLTNTSAAETILSAPATPVIGVTQN